MMDAGPLGRLAAGLMELVETEHPEGEIRAVLVLADVRISDASGEAWTTVRWQFGTAADGWNPKRSSSAYAAGLCTTALTALTEGDDTPPD
jgi:hypothetical protein